MTNHQGTGHQGTGHQGTGFRSVTANALATTLDGLSMGWFDGGQHIYPLLAQFEDTDAGGIVYHANYVNFAERGRTAMLRCLGVEMNDLVTRDEAIVITQINVSFKQPSFMGERLLVTTIPKGLGATKLKLQQLVASEDGTLKASLDVEGAFVSNNKPIRVPTDIREKIEAKMTASGQVV